MNQRVLTTYTTHVYKVPRMFITYCLCALLTLSSLISSAAAQNKSEKNKTALIAFRTDQYDFETLLRSEIAKRLGKNSNVKLTDESSTKAFTNELWRQAAKSSKNKIRLAKKNFVKGKNHYDKLSLEQAIKHFSSAVNLYREGIGGLKDNRYLMVSHLYLGMSLVVLGKEREGQRYIREMIILDPKRATRVLSKREFPPRVIELHKSLTQKIVKGASGQLNVNVEPAGAKIYLNGLLQKYSGKTFSSRLPAGNHFLMIEKKGYRQLAKVFKVKSKPVNLSLTLEEWQPLAPYTLQKRNNLIALNELENISKDLSANMLILGDIKKVSGKDDRFVLSSQVYDRRSREFSKIQSIESSRSNIDRSAKSLAKKIASQVSKQGFVVADIRTAQSLNDGLADANANAKPINKKPSDSTSGAVKPSDETLISRQQPSGNANMDAKKPIFKRKWFLFGVGAIAAGAGGYLVYDKVINKPDSNRLSITPSGP